jgi:hypothetical protein
MKPNLPALSRSPFLPLRLFRFVAIAWLCLLGAGTASAQGRLQPEVWVDGWGPYVYFAGGANQYDHDCYYYYDCATVRTSVGKAGAGYRFGRFGVEGWYADFGRGRIDPLGNTLRLRAGGVNGVLSVPFSSATEGLLRLGLADVLHERSDDFGGTRNRTLSFAAGLALVLHLSRNIAIEVALDATGGEGRNTSSVTASAFTAGLRLSF